MLSVIITVRRVPFAPPGDGCGWSRCHRRHRRPPPLLGGHVYQFDSKTALMANR